MIQNGCEGKLKRSWNAKVALQTNFNMVEPQVVRFVILSNFDFDCSPCFGRSKPKNGGFHAIVMILMIIIGGGGQIQKWCPQRGGQAP